MIRITAICTGRTVHCRAVTAREYRLILPANMVEFGSLPGHRYRGDLPRRLFARLLTGGFAALCAGFLLLAVASLAARDVSAAASDRPALAVDQEMVALLRKVEQQVSAGHAMSPMGDNAMETWMHVLQADRAAPASPGIHAALADFVVQMRSRASEERAAGRLVVASDLTVFADQANRVLGRSSTPLAPESSQTASSRPIPEPQSPQAAATGVLPRGAPPVEPLAAPVRSPVPAPAPTEQRAVGVASLQATVAPGNQVTPSTSLVKGATNINPAVPAAAPVSGIPMSGIPVSGGVSTSRATDIAPAERPTLAAAVSIPVPAISPPPMPVLSPPPPAAGPPAEAAKVEARPASTAVALAIPGPAPASSQRAPEVVTALLRRGDAMLRDGDVLGARLFFERAAAAGSGQGATNAGKTYDPNFLASIDAPGMKGDVTRAIEWYQRASTVLGDKEGGERLKVLIAQSGPSTGR